MAIFIIGGIVAADPASNCTDPGYLSQETCEDASNAGTGIGVVVLWFIWFFVFIALSLIWFMSRPKGRDCPACGGNVKEGHTACPSCGFDFAAAVGHAPPPPPEQQTT
jgi:hypothetical protein